MTSSGIPLTHRLGKKRLKLNLQIFDGKIFQSCNVVLLPVKSLRESVQLLPSQFEYLGPMDLTQVIIHSVKRVDQFMMFTIYDHDDMTFKLIFCFSSQSRKLEWWRNWMRGVWLSRCPSKFILICCFPFTPFHLPSSLLQLLIHPLFFLQS